MRPTDNPYSPGAGSPPPELAGRDDLLSRASIAIRRIQRGRHAQGLFLLGLRGVGKTVLLNRINQIAEELGCHTALFEADGQSSLPDLLTPQIHRLLLRMDRRERVAHEVRNAFAQLRGFAAAFSVKFADFEIGLSEQSSSGDLTLDLSDLLISVAEAAKVRQTAAVILIDEVQFTTKEDLSALVVAMHQIAQRQLPLILIAAGLPQLAGLAGEAKSYAERLFTYEQIGKLTPEKSREALVLPAEEEGVRFETEAVDLILRETEGYPFFLQVWGSYAWDVARQSPITVADARRASEKSIASLDSGFFKVRTDRLTARQLEYVVALASVEFLPASSTEVAQIMRISVSDAAPIRSTVIKKGVVYSPARGRVDFTVPKFADYIKRNLI